MISIASFLSSAANTTPSPDNSQPWQLNWEDEILKVCYDSQRVSGQTFPAESHATVITMGALAENLRQAAAAVPIHLDWSFPNILNTEDPVYFKISVEKIDQADAPTPESVALFSRHTNRHPYRNDPIPEDIQSTLEDFRTPDAKIIMFQEKSAIRKIAELVKTASEVRFQTREVHEWLAKSLRFDVKPDDQFGEGLDVSTIDLPPGGRLFLRYISDWRRMSGLNALGGYKIMAAIDSHLVKNAPLLLAITGSDTFRGTMAAGQLMNRAWIALNQHGIAVHPYYVITDQLQRRRMQTVPSHLCSQIDDVFHRAQQIFALNKNETVHMLFRIGYPARIPIKSKRLPLKTICHGLPNNECA